MVGMRGVGEQLKSILKKPWTVGKLFHLLHPQFPIPHQLLVSPAQELAKQISQFAGQCQSQLIKLREGILDREYIQARLGDIAIELFTSSCVFARLGGLKDVPNLSQDEYNRQWQTGLFYLKTAMRRNRQRFHELKDNDDTETNQLADLLLAPS
jgi:hypothetical protein